MAEPCINPKCTHKRAEVTRFPTSAEVWPVVEHCECGKHTRSMTREQFRTIWLSRRG